MVFPAYSFAINTLDGGTLELLQSLVLSIVMRMTESVGSMVGRLSRRRMTTLASGDPQNEDTIFLEIFRNFELLHSGQPGGNYLRL